MHTRVCGVYPYLLLAPLLDDALAEGDEIWRGEVELAKDLGALLPLICRRVGGREAGGPRGGAVPGV